MDKAKKRLEKLVESVELLRDVFDTENHGMCIVDKDGKIVEWNYEKLFDIKEEETIGKHVTECLENTRLHIVVKTGKKELYQLQEIGGVHVIANRIPIEFEGEIIGAAGTVVFKDTKEIEKLYIRLERIGNNLKEYQSELVRMYSAKYTFDDIKTENAEMLHLKAVAKLAANSDATILLQGESGTGKELFAQAIHQSSQVSGEPFVTINCAAIPGELLESELFGYEGGAFTGSRKEGRVGKFELVGNGTLFLDELGTLPLNMQVKLLRVLESREFERVGSNKKLEFSARVIGASNENLPTLVAQGGFRKDLYYRLNVISFEIPPLRKRLDDIECLCRNILSQKQCKYNTNCVSISEEAVQALKCYDWPGNIRELRNVIERALILCEGTMIELRHLTENIQRLICGSDQEIRSHTDYFKREVAKLEKRLIEEGLAASDGNRAKAAKILGIHRSVLYKKMHDYGIPFDEI